MDLANTYTVIRAIVRAKKIKRLKSGNIHTFIQGSKPLKVKQLCLLSDEDDDNSNLPDPKSLHDLLLIVDRFADFKEDHVLVHCKLVNQSNAKSIKRFQLSEIL